MTENDVRDVVFKRLGKKGWITEAVVHDISPNSNAIKVVWTDIGIKKMRAFHALFDELGYHQSHIGGEFEILCALSRQCVGQHL